MAYYDGGYMGNSVNPASGMGGYFGDMNGWSPYYAEDMAALEADRDLVNATADGLPYELKIIAAQRELEKAQLDLVPGDMAALDAQRQVIEARLGLIPGELAALQAEQDFRKAQFEAGALDMPLFEANRDQSKLQSQQAIEAAMANAAVSLAGNDVSRAGIGNERRTMDRDLRSLPASVAANYRGSSYTDPGVRARQDDIAAEMGILGKREAVLGLDDSRIRQSETHTRNASAAADRVTDAQFARQQASFGTRDEELASMDAQFANRMAQLGVAGHERNAAMAQIDAQAGRLGLAQKQYDARMASLASQEQRANLMKQQQAAQLADLEARQVRLQRPQGSNGGIGGGGNSFGGWQGGNGGWGFDNGYRGGNLLNNSAYPFFDTNQTYFNYG